MQLRWKRLVRKHPFLAASPVAVEKTSFFFNPVVQLPEDGGTYALAPFRESYTASVASVKVFLFRPLPGGGLERLSPVARCTVFKGVGVETGVDIYRVAGRDIVAALLIHDDYGYAHLTVAAPKEFTSTGRILKELKEELEELGVEEVTKKRIVVEPGRRPPFLTFYPGGARLVALPLLERDWREEESAEYSFRFIGYAGDRKVDESDVEATTLKLTGSPAADDKVVLINTGGIPFAVIGTVKPEGEKERLYIIPFMPTSLLARLIPLLLTEAPVEPKDVEILHPQGAGWDAG